MNTTETEAPDTGCNVRTLRDDELEAVTGGTLSNQIKMISPIGNQDGTG